MVNVTYTGSAIGIPLSRISDGFFEGWTSRPSREKLQELLLKSPKVIIAVHQETQEVIGFITAMTDGMASAYIPFLEVLPQYRNQGIGSSLVTRMMEYLGPIYMLDLVCNEDKVEFYQRLGFKPTRAMSRRNYDLQSLA